MWHWLRPLFRRQIQSRRHGVSYCHPQPSSCTVSTQGYNLFWGHFIIIVLWHPVLSWWPRHISIYRLAHRELWAAHQPLCNYLIIITISTGSALCTIYWDSQTSVSECEASASTALVPLIKLMMCVRQISFYFAHKIPKAEQQLETTPYLYDSSNRRSLHNIFTTPRFVLCCIWKNTFWKKYVFLLWILSHLKGLQVLYGLLNNGFKVWLYYHNLWHPNYVLIIILEGMWCFQQLCL